MKTILLATSLLLASLILAPGVSAEPNVCDGDIDKDCIDDYDCRYEYEGHCYGYTGNPCLYYVAGSCVPDARYYLHQA